MCGDIVTTFGRVAPHIWLCGNTVTHMISFVSSLAFNVKIKNVGCRFAIAFLCPFGSLESLAE